MKKTTDKIEIMQAYQQGKPIQYRELCREYCNWEDLESNETYEPCWDWSSFDYRLKPNETKRIMTFDEIVSYWKSHRTEIYTIHYETSKVSEGYICCVDYEDESFYVSGLWYTVDEMYNCITREDGSKFEIKEVISEQ